MTEQRKIKLEVLIDQEGLPSVLIALAELAEQRADEPGSTRWEYHRNARRVARDLREIARDHGLNPVLASRKETHNERETT